ncbi:MFS transporter [Pseudonocardia broussonetiae]|uniref:MFS transporter n=1 Tax=Pseudonocardia broussonetiae TaxID=2736640 RepID=A0A6M6JGA4_9PSEU|nr:MFS transporter [Pseudonocardia broussonetiae]QJY46080.1 MFS transporter [Pseudonocardia broussonetiae]
MTAPRIHRTPRSVLLLCLLCMTFEGYDVIAFGASVPLLLADATWGVDIAQAGLLGALTPVGMLLGAVVVGLLTDRLGRRRLILVSTAVFSVAMVLCAVAPGIPLFGIGRLLVGLGAGGVLPSIAALVYEYSAPGRQNIDTAVAFAGVGAGGGLAAAVTGLLGPQYGFRVVYLIGGLAAIVALPVIVRFLPESLVFLRGRGDTATARRWASRLGLDPALAAPEADAPTAVERTVGLLRVVFSRTHRRTTALFCLATFVSLLVVFGLYTWLPQLMRSAGYELGSALTFLIVLNVGTALGPLVVGRIADRIGSRPTTVGSFLLAALSIAVLSQPLPGPLLYAAVVIAGVGTVGTQILINVFIASHYPVQVRATAIGTALSAGRLGGILGPLYGAALLSADLPTATLFYAFAAPAVLGALVIAAVPTSTTAPVRATRPDAAPSVQHRRCTST